MRRRHFCIVQSTWTSSKRWVCMSVTVVANQRLDLFFHKVLVESADGLHCLNSLKRTDTSNNFKECYVINAL